MAHNMTRMTPNMASIGSHMVLDMDPHMLHASVHDHKHALRTLSRHAPEHDSKHAFEQSIVMHSLGANRLHLFFDSSVSLSTALACQVVAQLPSRPASPGAQKTQ